ncbi:hypothetical protein BFP76_01955 [Amylibacter kogurei]|uniref:AAA domain-containing protein n=1 Tax=Paramylibacter kogurei TaxID=1889778 RepID=A0A2G5K3C0_9RHOB|nr:AAA family ATPase [Amylibacter kogurei]PIB24038.1 hypothetical protein BFP76_01955 [Amylibacter kogurei]
MTSDNSGRIIACAIAPNLEAFDQIIDQMQDLFGENWGGLNLEDALPVLNSRHSEQMDHVLIAIDETDDVDIENIVEIVGAAKSRQLSVTLVTKNLDAVSLQQLMRSDADDFLPYPLPDGALKASFAKAEETPVETKPAAPMMNFDLTDTGAPSTPIPQDASAAPAAPAIEDPAPVAEPDVAAATPTAAAPEAPTFNAAPEPQDVQPAAEPAPQAQPETPAPTPAAPQEAPQAAPSNVQPIAPPAPAPQQAPVATGKDGILLPVYGLAGGVGASTLAANLAWEIQNIIAKDDAKVCLLDFGFQFGSIATYLDVGRSDIGLELLSSGVGLDSQAFSQAVPKYKGKLDVLPAPIDAVPLEVADAEEIAQLLDLVTSMYDYVIVDLPTALVSWSEAVLQRAKLYLAVGEVEMRTAQNALRFLRVLKSDDLPYEKVQFIMNRAPKKTDLSGRSRMKRMSDSLNVEFRWALPDGGKQVLNACDQGTPLAEVAGRNPLRKEIRKIAENLVSVAKDSADVKARA